MQFDEKQSETYKKSSMISCTYIYNVLSIATAGKAVYCATCT